MDEHTRHLVFDQVYRLLREATELKKAADKERKESDQQSDPEWMHSEALALKLDEIEKFTCGHFHPRYLRSEKYYGLIAD